MHCSANEPVAVQDMEGIIVETGFRVEYETRGEKPNPTGRVVLSIFEAPTEDQMDTDLRLAGIAKLPKI